MTAASSPRKLQLHSKCWPVQSRLLGPSDQYFIEELPDKWVLVSSFHYQELSPLVCQSQGTQSTSDTWAASCEEQTWCYLISPCNCSSCCHRWHGITSRAAARQSTVKIALHGNEQSLIEMLRGKCKFIQIISVIREKQQPLHTHDSWAWLFFFV